MKLHLITASVIAYIAVLTAWLCYSQLLACLRSPTPLNWLF